MLGAGQVTYPSITSTQTKVACPAFKVSACLLKDNYLSTTCAKVHQRLTFPVQTFCQAKVMQPRQSTFYQVKANYPQRTIPGQYRLLVDIPGVLLTSLVVLS